jgi:hypothetical protein
LLVVVYHKGAVKAIKAIKAITFFCAASAAHVSSRATFALDSDVHTVHAQHFPRPPHGDHAGARALAQPGPAPTAASTSIIRWLGCVAPSPVGLSCDGNCCQSFFRVESDTRFFLGVRVI